MHAHEVLSELLFRDDGREVVASLRQAHQGAVEAALRHLVPSLEGQQVRYRTQVTLAII